jgi:two-component system sensor kinase
LAARLYSRLAYANWFLRGQVATFWAHLNGLNLAERYPPTPELAQACSEHSISVTGLPRILFARGVRYAKRGLEIRRSRGDVWGQGQSLNFYGMLLYAFGHYDEALAKFHEALRLLQRTGDLWEVNLAAAHIAYCHYRLGSLQEALAQSRRVHRNGSAIGDRHAMGLVLEIWAKASGGAVPKELIEAALAEADPQIREAVLQGEGVRLIGAGHPQEAAAAFAAADTAVQSAHLKSEYVSYIPLWLAHARRLCAAQTVGDTIVPVPERLGDARRALRRGLRLARRYRGNLPMALRERALLAAMRGRRRGVRRDLDRSLAEAQRQHARFEAAQTQLARGEIGLAWGWSGAQAETTRARELLHELGADFACSPLRALPADDRAPVTLSLADRFASIVDQGRRIASALTPDEVHTAVCEASFALLRGQTNMVLAVEGDQPRVLAARGDTSRPSRSLLSRVLTMQRLEVLTEASGQSLPDSILLAAARSALCAPILVGGRPVAFLYVTHPLVGDLFGEEEKQLAGYLVTLAGASLDKAVAFADLQALSRTLEQRVIDRTAELRTANAELDENLRRLRETQGQLVQSAKMATVGTLVAGLSHEINNPLTVILGQAQSQLRRMTTDDPARPAMAAVERQAHRCADLVGSLLDFARQRPSNREVIPLEALLRRVLDLTSARMRRSDVGLEVELRQAASVKLEVVPSEIESALLNVINNAVDASAPGAVVRVDAALAQHESRSGVRIDVLDHGTGIASDVLVHVFDPFFTTKPVGQGTGLGLSLARQFVERHGGRLTIESELGKGTIVHLWLPSCHEPTET